MTRHTLMVLGVAAALGFSTGVWGQHGTGGGFRTEATVEQIDRQASTLHLRTEGGDTVELKVPQQVLMGLQQGDRVHVAIERAPEEKGAPSAPAR